MPSTKPARMCCTTRVGGQFGRKGRQDGPRARLTPPVDAPSTTKEGARTPEATGLAALFRAATGRTRGGAPGLFEETIENPFRIVL